MKLVNESNSNVSARVPHSFFRAVGPLILLSRPPKKLFMSVLAVVFFNNFSAMSFLPDSQTLLLCRYESKPALGFSRSSVGDSCVFPERWWINILNVMARTNKHTHSIHRTIGGEAKTTCQNMPFFLNECKALKLLKTEIDEGLLNELTWYLKKQQSHKSGLIGSKENILKKIHCKYTVNTRCIISYIISNLFSACVLGINKHPDFSRKCFESVLICVALLRFSLDQHSN